MLMVRRRYIFSNQVAMMRLMVQAIHGFRSHSLWQHNASQTHLNIELTVLVKHIADGVIVVADGSDTINYEFTSSSCFSLVVGVTVVLPEYSTVPLIHTHNIFGHIRLSVVISERCIKKY